MAGGNQSRRKGVGGGGDVLCTLLCVQLRAPPSLGFCSASLKLMQTSVATQVWSFPFLPWVFVSLLWGSAIILVDAIILVPAAAWFKTYSVLTNDFFFLREQLKR